NLPILTKLSVIQCLAVLCVAIELEIPIDVSLFENFRPKENRLVISQYQDTRIFFDGDATYGGRMAALADHFYGADAGLVILQKLHSQDSVREQMNEFGKVREGFSRISIIDSIGDDWLKEFSPILKPDR